MKISALPVWVIVVFGLTGSMNAQNDKKVIGDAVFTTTEIAIGVDVLFLIRFENIGADTAFNIVVRDTLDPRFNAATFHMVDASHSYQLLHDQGFIRWYFNGIRLPSSDTEEEDNDNATGYLMYTVQPHRFLTAGQTIHNNACISFDEETICTNTATVWIDGESEIEEAFDEKRIYRVVPNPNY
ncbi:MAG: hypothetical protein JNJ57_13180, partial [Saprospiraceae bacterium]|nr:hypothetical protein [Saprospiraceae bacterium]